MSEKITLVLTALPSLSKKELDVVVATANALSGLGAGKPRKRKDKKGKPKGPKMVKSKFDELPEFRRFKKAQKDLKALLKANDISLKDAESSDRLKADPALLEFHESRELWFVKKAGLSNDAN